MTSKSQRSTRRKNAVMSLCLVAVMLITGAFAYLTDTDTATNVFTVGDVKIDLTEPSWDPDNAEDIWAGKVMDKDPTIKNVGDNESYVYAMVTVPKADDLVIFDEVKGTATVNDYQLFSYELNPGWTLIDSKVDDNDANNYYLYAYDTALAPEGVTAPVFSKIEFANVIEDQFVEPENELDVIVDAYAIQSNFGADGTADQKSPEDAWKLYANQNGWEFPSALPDGLVTLNFVAESGDIVYTEVGQAGEPVDMYFEPSLAKPGYTFDWTDDAGNVGYSGMPMPEEDGELTATYTETGYGAEVSDYLVYVVEIDAEGNAYASVRDVDPAHENFPASPTAIVIPSTITFTTAPFKSVVSDDAASVMLSSAASAAFTDGTYSVPVKDVRFSYGEIEFSAIAETIVPPDGVTSINGLPRPGAANSNNDVLKNIVIPYGTIKLGNQLFLNFTKLESVMLPDTLTTLGNYVFRGCSSLKDVVLPQSVQLLGDEPFRGNTTLETLEMPLIKDMPNAMCYGCTALKTVVLRAQNGDAIPEYAFNGCNNLETVILPEGLKRIDSHAFRQNSSLENIVLPNSLEVIGTGAFYESGLVEITIPNGVLTIESGAFSCCANLVSIRIPVSVVALGSISACPLLTDVYYEGTEEQWNILTEGMPQNAFNSATIHFES